MNRKLVVTVATACAVAVPAAHAMFVNPHGTGQVLVFPYYTANGGNDTLLELSNPGDHAKALKIRFHEGYDGRGVLDLDVYLPAHGQWSASVTSAGDAASAARLVTSDSACTVPAFTALPSGARTLDFSDASYAGENTSSGPTGQSDGGPVTPDRTREGHFDVFEMGEVTGDAHGSLDAITSGDCGALAGAWSAGGYWSANPDADLSAPAGGLYGVEYVIDVARGTMFAVNAVAIDAFANAVDHTAPGAAKPDLDSATPAADGRFQSLVFADGAALNLEYDDPVDAVSALFMTDALRGDFIRSASLGARTDWIVTAPTKRFYVDPGFVGVQAAQPFEFAFEQGYTGGSMTVGGVVTEEWGGSFPYACERVGAAGYGRDGSKIPLGAFDAGGGVQPPPDDPGSGAPSSPLWANPSVTPCLETSVFAFSTKTDPTNAQQPQSALGSALLDANDPGNHAGRVFDYGVDLLPAAGSAVIDFAHDNEGLPVPTHQLAAATNGAVLSGLPVVAFAATTFVNGDVSNGVLANYGASAAVRSGVACATPGGPCR